MIIFGAGMAGLLTASMLRRFTPAIFEAKPSLPHNHQALLRFRSDVVSQATGIPFRKVMVHKDLMYAGAYTDLALCNMYSEKVTGEVRDRSIISVDPQKALERYIAPPDFIAQLAASATISYHTSMTRETIAERTSQDVPMISTIPMNVLMELADWPKDQRPEFKWRPIWTLTAHVDLPRVDVYQTYYYPERDVPWYRASLTGDRVIIEAMNEIEEDEELQSNWVYQVLHDFGIDGAIFSPPHVHKQEFGKLVPVAEDHLRKAFILAMTDRYNIYSVGRFATWRQIVLDDVVHDIRIVERFITERNMYNRKLSNLEIT